MAQNILPMERLKSLKTITLILSGILIFELAFLAYQVKPRSLVAWLTIGLVAICSLMLVRISIGLINELKDKTKE